MSEIISILGGTGSIGDHTLDIVRQHSGRFQIGAVTAYENVEKLIKICHEYHPKFVVIGKEALFPRLREGVKGLDIELSCGESGIIEAAQYPADRIMASITGFAGLKPTLEALKQGTIVMLANKECLVSAGQLFMQVAEQENCQVLPVDSEHNALYQLLVGQELNNVKKMVLTASGGPFLYKSLDELKNVTVEEACRHPNWSMGAKISIDSANLMNKGLELIEAQYLFNIDINKLEVLIHPQSKIHGLLHMIDGTILSQMSISNMNVPIAYCLGYPERLNIDIPELEFERFDFMPVDIQKFPCFSLTKEVMKIGKNAAIILNSANEVAVQAFRNQKIGFLQIPRIIEECLNQVSIQEVDNLEMVFQIDHEVRIVAQEAVSILEF